MIYCFSCDCGGAEPIIRDILRSANYKGWLDKPIHRGKEEARRMLLTKEAQEYVACRALIEHIERSSTYVVVLGVKGDQAIWADAGRGDVKSRLDAQIIAEEFAE